MTTDALAVRVNTANVPPKPADTEYKRAVTSLKGSVRSNTTSPWE